MKHVVKIVVWDKERRLELMPLILIGERFCQYFESFKMIEDIYVISSIYGGVLSLLVYFPRSKKNKVVNFTYFYITKSGNEKLRETNVALR